MTTDSALRELVRRFRDNQRFHESEVLRSEDKVVIEARKASADAWQMAASRLESILTAAPSQQPAPAGMVLVPRKVTEAMNDAYNDVPSGFAGSPPASQWVWDAMLAAAPPPTLNEAFDQVGAAMMREVCGEGASVSEADPASLRYAIVSALEYLRAGDGEQAVSMLESALSLAAAPAAQVAAPDGVLSYGVRRAVAEWEKCKSPLQAQHAMTAIANDLRNNPVAAPAVVVDEAMVERFCSAADDGFGWSDAGRTQVRRGLAAALKGDVS